MLRSVLSGLHQATKNVRCLGSLLSTSRPINLSLFSPRVSLIEPTIRNFSVNLVNGVTAALPLISHRSSGLLQPKSVLVDTVRTNIKFSKTKGKRKTVKVVLKKFYRLNWGCWIHAKCGRHKRLYKKSAARRRRLQYHVFCNSTQSMLLDKMVTRYWRKPKYYVDDSYEPYHTREEFKLTRSKPYDPFL
ncbi:39S ribosomal protein L35, mitochondrial [Homalodisca vitripennis]|uniref:39S ribosomal protein L35, mitochondrial n=1 Tax=Homalodisca vitripennis TaxID=197043 RepID=UPI001EEA710A|nr:39S ribosomal protein L35, mitochondrial [Homalodisca vitripennis]